MSNYKYAFQGFDEKTMARCVVTDLPISTKQSIEIAKFIRNRSVEKAKELLVKIEKMDMALKFTRARKQIAHKPGIGPGRYPIKACGFFRRAIESAEKNAVYKGFDAKNLVIVHIAGQMASRPMKFSRRTRGKSKRTHVEVVLQEVKTEHKTKNDTHKKENKIKEDKK